MKYKVGDKVRLKKETTAWTNSEMKALLGKTVTIIGVYRSHYSFAEDKGMWCWDDRSIEGYAREQKIVITTDGTKTIARLYEGKKVVKTATAKCSPDDTFDFNTGARLAYDRLMEEGDSRFKFKVGDKVVSKRAGIKGMVGTVICIKEQESHYGVEFESVTDGHDCGAFRLLYGKTGRNGHCWWHSTSELEEYTEPQYYNGKVVCVEGDDSGFTVGKVYEFVNGRAEDDKGNQRPAHRRIKNLTADCRHHKFIPFVE